MASTNTISPTLKKDLNPSDKKICTDNVKTDSLVVEPKFRARNRSRSDSPTKMREMFGCYYDPEESHYGKFGP